MNNRLNKKEVFETKVIGVQRNSEPKFIECYLCNKPFGKEDNKKNIERLTSLRKGDNILVFDNFNNEKLVYHSNKNGVEVFMDNTKPFGVMWK